MKTGTKVLIGAGVAAGAAGIGYALYKSRKKSSGSRTSSEDSRVDTASAEYSSTMLHPGMALDLSAREPLGWLGTVIMHGGLCTTFSIEYMTSKKYGDHRHLLPQLLAVKQTGSSGNYTLDWHRDTLMVNRFAEWPSPVFHRCSPMFVAPYDWTDFHGTKTLNSGGNKHDWAEALLIPEQIPFYLWPSYTRDRRDCIVQRSHFSEFHVVTASGVYLSRHDPSFPHLPVYPAKRVVDWISWASGNGHLVSGKGLSAAQSAIQSIAGADALKRGLVVPVYYRQSTARLYEWRLRISKWYATAQWLVWAGEMMRLHCPGLRLVPAPSWWRTHCAAWAIGVPSTAQQVARQVFSDDRGTSEPDLQTKLTPAETLEILRLIMKYTPVPGTKGMTGEQIAAPGERRHLCDMPDSLGSMLPPIELVTASDENGAPNPWWAMYAISYWRSRLSTFHWAYDVVIPVVNAIASCAGGAASGAVAAAASAATTIAQQVIYRVASFALQAMCRMARGDVVLNAGDIVGLIGDAVNLSGLTDDLQLKGIPLATWNSIKAFGAEIEKIPGVDWDQVEAPLKWVQSNLHNIKAIDGWDYIDQGFGGIGLSGRVRDAALDTLGKLNLAR